MFSDELCAENRYDVLVLRRKKAEKKQGFCYPLPKEGEVCIQEAGICCTIRQGGEPVEFLQDVCTKVFDYDKIEVALFCRTRKAGDWMRLKNGRKKVKDMFIDEKIPKEEREQYPLVAAGQEVLWIPGVRCSFAALPDEHTKRYVYIQIRRVQK